MSTPPWWPRWNRSNPRLEGYLRHLPPSRLWVNPDYGLKTRRPKAVGNLIGGEDGQGGSHAHRESSGPYAFASLLDRVTGHPLGDKPRTRDRGQKPPGPRSPPGSGEPRGLASPNLHPHRPSLNARHPFPRRGARDLGPPFPSQRLFLPEIVAPSKMPPGTPPNMGLCWTTS